MGEMRGLARIRERSWVKRKGREGLCDAGGEERGLTSLGVVYLGFCCETSIFKDCCQTTFVKMLL